MLRNIKNKGTGVLVKFPKKKTRYSIDLTNNWSNTFKTM